MDGWMAWFVVRQTQNSHSRGSHFWVHQTLTQTHYSELCLLRYRDMPTRAMPSRTPLPVVVVVGVVVDRLYWCCYKERSDTNNILVLRATDSRPSVGWLRLAMVGSGGWLNSVASHYIITLLMQHHPLQS